MAYLELLLAKPLEKRTEDPEVESCRAKIASEWNFRYMLYIVMSYCYTRYTTYWHARAAREDFLCYGMLGLDARVTGRC